MYLLNVNFALSENFAIRGLPNTLSFSFLFEESVITLNAGMPLVNPNGLRLGFLFGEGHAVGYIIGVDDYSRDTWEDIRYRYQPL